MQIIRWTRPTRQFSQSEVDDFYERSLVEPTLFRFTTSNTELPEHGGSLSLKLVLSGEETYLIEGRSLKLRQGQMMFINQGQHYASRISCETESLCVFFPDLDEAALQASTQRTDAELLASGLNSSGNHHIPQLPFSVDQDTEIAIHELLASLRQSDTHISAEKSRLLAVRALQSLQEKAPWPNLDSVKKPATRDELMRRLLRAHELIEDSRGQVSRLEELAEHACLSKYYFLRLFTQVFGVPPNAFARQLRLRTAAADIRGGTHPRTAAREAGYRDFRAFRRACSRILGFDPLQKSQFQTTFH